jgi:hypothetical protein
MVTNNLEMNFDEIREWRKYYFSLAPEILHYHLMCRRVPVFYDDGNKATDFVLKLYEEINEFSSFDVDTYYIEQKIWKYIPFFKKKLKTRHSHYELLKCKKIKGAPRYVIWYFYSGSFLVQKYDPRVIDNVKVYFHYELWHSRELFLLDELQKGVRFSNYKILADLSDEIYFDVWYLRKCLNK